MPSKQRHTDTASGGVFLSHAGEGPLIPQTCYKLFAATTQNELHHQLCKHTRTGLTGSRLHCKTGCEAKWPCCRMLRRASG